MDDLLHEWLGDLTNTALSGVSHGSKSLTCVCIVGPLGSVVTQGNSAKRLPLFTPYHLACYLDANYTLQKRSYEILTRMTTNPYITVKYGPINWTGAAVARYPWSIHLLSKFTWDTFIYESELLPQCNRNAQSYFWWHRACLYEGHWTSFRSNFQNDLQARVKSTHQNCKPST